MFFCEKCQNTGGTEPGGDLDCTAPGCDAAVKRAEFNKWLLQMGWPDGRMKEWQIYRQGERNAQDDINSLQCRLELADMRINALVDAKALAERRLFDSTQAALQRIIDFGQLQDAPNNDTAEEDAYVIDRMGKLLAGVAIALKGPEKALNRHGYQDLPELAAQMMQELELNRAAKAPNAPASTFPFPIITMPAGMSAEVSIGRVSMRAPAEQAQVFIEQSGDPSVQRIRELELVCAAKQATIDRLMLEYCPGEISAEQKDTWEASQRAVSGEAKPAATIAGPELYDLLREWAHLPKGARFVVANKIIDHIDTHTARAMAEAHKQGFLDGMQRGGYAPLVEPDSERDAALKKIAQAIEVNDSDSMSMLDRDEKVLWSASGSWSRPVDITLGDLRAIARTIDYVMPADEFWGADAQQDKKGGT